MNKIPCASQNTDAKTLACWCLVTLDSFHLPLSTQLTGDLTQEWSGGSMFHSLSHVYTKTPFCCVETVANNTLNRQRVIVFARLWANAAPTFNAAFSPTNVHAKWWIHCLLISATPLLSHATSIYDQPKLVCGVCWCFPGQLLNLGNLSRWQLLIPSPECSTPGRGVYVLLSTERLFCCITTFQCALTHRMLQAGIETHLTLC